MGMIFDSGFASKFGKTARLAPASVLTSVSARPLPSLRGKSSMRYQLRWTAWPLSILIATICPLTLAASDQVGPPLPGTKPLTMTGDIASELVAGVDRFLLKQIDESTAERAKYWKRDFSSLAAYDASVEPNRKRLAHILGVRDPRHSSTTAEHLTASATR